jgi:hypothetical protein
VVDSEYGLILSASTKAALEECAHEVKRKKDVCRGAFKVIAWMGTKPKIRTLHFESSRTLQLRLGNGLRITNSLETSFLYFRILSAKAKLDIPTVSGKSLLFS